MQPTQEATPTLEDTCKAVEERAGPGVQEAQAQWKQFNDQAKTFVRKNPGVALAGALAIGFLFGRWASRK